MSGNLVIISCEPSTVWALEERERPEAVIALVNECASQFVEAMRRSLLVKTNSAPVSSVIVSSFSE